MNHKGKIYGFVGVIGSGKSYAIDSFIQDCGISERPFIVGDFSEGIRMTLLNIFGTPNSKMDVNSQAYSDWKKLEQRIFYPVDKNLVAFPINGRKFLQNTGEYLKQVVGEDVWARWTYNYVVEKLSNMNIDDVYLCEILFGSVRFDFEAKVIFDLAQSTGKDVTIYFCDYHSERYELSDHKSEKFAQYFLNLGCKDGEDITSLVKEKIYGRI